MDDSDVSRRGFVAAVGSAVAGGLAGCSIGQPRADATSQSSTLVDSTPATTLGATRDPEAVVTGSSFTEVYRATIDSVAAVRVDSVGGSAQGTAWSYDPEHFVTNEHVVGDGETISLRFTGAGWRDASVVGTDVYSDLAVLSVDDRPESATPLPLVESPPPVGAHVAVIGNPFGLSGSLSAGVISGRGRTLPAPNGFSIPDAIQTDAPLNPGNSGGPVVTLDGTVAGVANAGGGDNIGFGISAAMVRRVVPALIADGDYDHSYMGVGIEPVTPRLIRANDLSVRMGVYVDRAVEDGPAEGVLRGSTDEEFVQGRSISVGGDVIVRLDDTPIPDRQALSRFLALQTRPGDTIAVGFYRDGERRTASLTLGRRPEP
jgi:serine protease Do